MSGYRDRAYAESLWEFGTPRHLPRCDGWLLGRGIGESGYRDARLRDAFRDLVRPFMTHFVRDLSGPVQPSAHHRRRVRRRLELVRAEQCTEPGAHLDEWQALYAGLIERILSKASPRFRQPRSPHNCGFRESLCFVLAAMVPRWG